jgi:hypothetical protein
MEFASAHTARGRSQIAEQGGDGSGFPCNVNDWIGSLSRPGSAENLKSHIGEQTGKDYAAGGRHRSPAPFSELWRSVGKCQFSNAVYGNKALRNPSTAGPISLCIKL